MEERLLVVDDEKDICDILKFNLENEGYIVDVANSGEEALKILSNVHNLIILDVMMNGISGFKMAEIDRKSTRLNSSHVRISYAVFCLKKKNKYRYPSASCFGLPHTGVRSIGVAFLAAASAALIDQAAAEGEPGAPDRPVPCLAKRRSD